MIGATNAIDVAPTKDGYHVSTPKPKTSGLLTSHPQPPISNVLARRWSLGCILAELWTGRVLFQNDSLATLLARVVGILGGIEENLLLQVTLN